MLKKINGLFPFWAIGFGICAFFKPDFFVEFKGWINYLLMAIMFFMGLTLSIDDFKRVTKKPIIILLTVGLQFLLMPLFALLISKVMGFDQDVMVGMILVGAVSGGTASNVMTYLAKGDVALSVSMTMLSTLLSIVLTPIIISLYLSSKVEVDSIGILKGLVQIIFVPIILGAIGNMILKQKVDKICDVLTSLSMISIIFIIAIVVALNQPKMSTVGLLVFVGVILHNGLGLLSGYYCTKLLGYDETICRTVAIEVGMQNSGLASSLGLKYFTELSALPGAIFSVWHNVSGSILAGYWAKKQK
ncbi:bile acid:sodium symporter family protein [Thorsellia anophelis]|uniref:Bile acid:Na+ symporter, BASS family n=1 Tax=Thorsellia anophelis DSM 18579 TaxID=1123402 RepID=A0A1I0E5I3_9GAMM|nr:bile acid:sodium symporter family protein [Thorsellia anophelis]SET40408.1 bile acid:Na+ symporter, BASS family [Thorsellia anophelis DSM 18579]